VATLIVKFVVTSLLVVAISELARRSRLAGALLASLPLTSLLALIPLYRDTGDAAQAADLARASSGSCCRRSRSSSSFPPASGQTGDSARR
jgi:hypothetical protein